MDFAPRRGCKGTGLAFNRDTGIVCNLLAIAGQTIENGRLAAIGVADKGLARRDRRRIHRLSVSEKRIDQDGIGVMAANGNTHIACPNGKGISAKKVPDAGFRPVFLR